MFAEKNTIILLALFALISCSEKKPVTEYVKETFTHNGQDREYIYYAPAILVKDAPLMVVLHGFTSNAENIMNYSGMNAIAKEKGFAVVYPQGTKDEKSNTFWNVGYEFHSDIDVDDVDYIIALVKYLQKKYALSTTNTFITGMSNGGEMSYLLSCRYPDIFKAAAPIAGTMMHSFFEDCTPVDPIPIFAVFGTKDDITNFMGDTENKDGWGAYQSIPFIIDFWTKTIVYDSLKTDTLPDLVKEDSSFVISKKYINSLTGNEFLYYEVEGGGHDWPGAWGNMDINASREIWRFFERYVE